MFNPYAIRPIGSERFLEHLKDVQTKTVYRSMMPEEDGLVRTAELQNAHAPWWDGNTVIDPWEQPWVRLQTAITAMAVLDYLECWKQERYPECAKLERDYFRSEGWLTELLELLATKVIDKGDEAIRQCEERMKKLLRWNKTGRKEEEDG